jgi:hypothetical protein
MICDLARLGEGAPYRTTARAGHTQAVIADYVVPYLVAGTVHAHLAVRQSPTKVRYSRIAVSSTMTCAGPSLLNGQSDRLQIIQQSFVCSSYFGSLKEAHWSPLSRIHRPGLSAIWQGRGRVHFGQDGQRMNNQSALRGIKYPNYLK